MIREGPLDIYGTELNELEIIERLTRDHDDPRRLTIAPIVDLESQIGASSIDVHLGTEFRITKQQLYTHLNLFEEKSELERQTVRYMELVTIRGHPKHGGFILHPGHFALGSTLQYVCLPDDLSARLEGRSSWGRLGLQIHSTAGLIDPGFKGTITYELTNLGTAPIVLYAGLRVGQLAFYTINESLLGYSKKRYSKYQFQTGPAPSRFYEDKEIEILRSLWRSEK